jgi:hypothetical protein
MGETPTQPVVGYVGYALNEPWGQPRAVIGFSADEAERLADLLERGSERGMELAQRHIPGQPAAPGREPAPEVKPGFLAVTGQ